MVFTIRVELFHSSIFCFVNSDKDEMRRCLEELSKHYELDVDEYIADTEKGNYEVRLGNDYVVYIADVEYKGGVAHELLHAAHAMLTDRGIAVGDNAEILAYTLGYITDVFYDLYDKTLAEGEKKAA